jgi:hypothetical protein
MILRGVHQRRFNTVLDELVLFFDKTLRGRLLAARSIGDLGNSDFNDLLSLILSNEEIYGMWLS